MSQDTSLINIIGSKDVDKDKEIIKRVYLSLLEKGYDPEAQIAGYIMTGDPTYITSYNKARAIITNVDRDELMIEMIKTYIEKIF